MPTRMTLVMVALVLVVSCANADSYRVFGTITTDAGDPLVGVRVSISGADEVAITGARGEYEVAGIPSGTSCTIKPSHPGYSFKPASREVTITSGDEWANFTAADAQAGVCGVASGGEVTALAIKGPTVTYPSAAGITWTRGDDYTITWQGFSTTNVRIQLWKNWSLDSTITTGTPNDGSFVWKLPVGTALGSDYLIRVSETGTGWTPDFSDNEFTVVDSVTTPKVTYPNAAGITWTRGDDYTITWQGFSTTNVRIQLWKGWSLDSTITTGTPNDGSFVWTVPTGTALGSDYLIRVSETGTGWTPDFSNNPFEIVAAPGTPKVTYPDVAGITWIRGDDYTITWQGFSTTDVRIQLWKGWALHSTITTGTPNDGSYTWTVPLGVTLGIDYLIRVSETGTSWTPDFSDNYFTIARGATAPRVTYPNAAGITWNRGDDYTITWEDFASADVRIQLWKNWTLDSTITTGTLNDGSYTWTVPIGTTLGSDYVIRVSETGTSWTPDFSDNEFTIADGSGRVVRRAVCVGISDYVGTDSDLSYCDDDARDFADALAAQGNWDAGNITVILDRQATAANIWAALNAMSAASDANDQCVFFFSGHGGWSIDQAPLDEPNGRDEYICETNLTNNIYDDALGQWVTDLPTTNVFVVLCSCFSGGFIKGENSVKCISGAQPDGDGSGFATEIQAAMDAKLAAVKDVDDAAAGVTLTAADYFETCQESGTLQHDVFNHYVLQAMAGAGDANSDGTITAEEIYAYAAPLATDFNSGQHAQIYDADTGQDFVLLY